MNQSLFYFLNGLAVKYPNLEPVFIFLANDFGLIAVFILGLYLFNHEDKKRGVQEIIMVVVIAIFAWFFAHFLKDIFNTDRPFIALQNVVQLLPHEADGAFPSGHATFYSALATMMWFYHKKIGIALGIVALIIGISRIISGIHWPVDILGGYVLGVLISVGVYFLIKKFR